MKTERIYSKFKPHLMKVSIFILIFTVIISVIIILQYNPTRSEINAPDTTSPPGWYQQYLPNVNNKPLSDLYFLDSLTGFFCTAGLPYNDTNYIAKTTNGGDNWFIVFRDGLQFRDIFFVNSTTGFVGGTKIFKTTNAGINWSMINVPFGNLTEATYVLNEDTIWFSHTEPLTGGIFRTTNGGASWQKRDNGITGNYPQKLYFYNSNIGFASFNPQSNLFKTTNGGENWFLISPNNGVQNIHFFDEFTGYKAAGDIKKTTDGGYNWVTQILPQSGNISNSFENMCVINRDTIWGTGGVYGATRGMIYKTTNGGNNWGYQAPITSPQIYRYFFIKFTDRKYGWAYSYIYGLHTITGGSDTTFFTGININDNNISAEFMLHQNYPNPFNSRTVIEYELIKAGNITLKIFDINGKEIQTLLEKTLSTGNYSVKFNAGGISTGIYFYRLEFTDFKNITYSKTKAMIYIK